MTERPGCRLSQALPNASERYSEIGERALHGSGLGLHRGPRESGVLRMPDHLGLQLVEPSTASIAMADRQSEKSLLQGAGGARQCGDETERSGTFDLSCR